jgi:hypothetical protein
VNGARRLRRRKTILTGVGEGVAELLELHARVRPVAPYRRVARILLNRLGVEPRGGGEIMACTNPSVSPAQIAYTERAPAKALLASALRVAAAALSSAETSMERAWS